MPSWQMGSAILSALPSQSCAQCCMTLHCSPSPPSSAPRRCAPPSTPATELPPLCGALPVCSPPHRGAGQSIASISQRQGRAREQGLALCAATVGPAALPCGARTGRVARYVRQAVQAGYLTALAASDAGVCLRRSAYCRQPALAAVKKELACQAACVLPIVSTAGLRALGFSPSWNSPVHQCASQFAVVCYKPGGMSLGLQPGSCSAHVRVRSCLGLSAIRVHIAACKPGGMPLPTP